MIFYQIMCVWLDLSSLKPELKPIVDLYSKEYNCPVKIVSRQEFVNTYEQKFGEYNLKSIVYGFGFMKRPKCRRVRITYIALMDENCKPVWGYVMPR